MTDPDRAASPDPPRDPDLDRAYAAGANEGPPARLDAAILAAARREAGAGPRRLGMLRAWRAPVALAAVLVLSVSVVLLLREEGADRLDQLPPSAAPPAVDSARRSEPAASAKLESARGAAPSADVAPQARDAPAPQPRAVEEDRRKVEVPSAVMQAPPPPAEAPPPAPRPFADPPAAPDELRAAPAAPPAQTGSLAKETDPGAAAGARERAATVEREAQAQRVPAPPAERTPASPGEKAVPPAEKASAPPVAAAPDAATGALGRSQVQSRRALPDANRMEQKPREDLAAAASRPVWQGFERQPPEKWLVRMEELRRTGRDEDAREMLMEFRKRFPQYPVPPSLDR